MKEAGLSINMTLGDYSGMNRKSTIILIGAGVLCVILLAIAFGGGANSDPDVRYNYETEISHGFKSLSGYEVKPDSGNVFVIVTIHAYNDKASSISLGPLTWAWKAQAVNKEYSVSFHTYSHPLYEDGDLLKGGNTRFALVFEIPAYAATYSIVEKFNWTFENIKRDTSIIV